MTNTTEIHRPIADILDEFFLGYQPNATAAVRARIAVARAALERALELEGPRVLTSFGAERLEAEKQQDPNGAFARTGRADDLYYALPLCLEEPHAVATPRERETQVDVIAAIADFLWRHRLITTERLSECAIIEFDIAIRGVRASLKGQARRF